jgi:hypothetical protein
MSDDRVLEGVEALVRQSNEITAELLAYLIEVEERGLHPREACSHASRRGGGTGGARAGACSEWS